MACCEEGRQLGESDNYSPIPTCSMVGGSDGQGELFGKGSEEKGLPDIMRDWLGVTGTNEREFFWGEGCEVRGGWGIMWVREGQLEVGLMGLVGSVE